MSGNTLGGRLRQALNDRGISMRALSTNSGIPYSSVQNYVADKQKPGADALTLIRNKLGVSVDWLLTGEGERFLSGVEIEPRPFELSDYFDLQKKFSDFDEVFRFQNYWSIPGAEEYGVPYLEYIHGSIEFALEMSPEIMSPILGGRKIEELNREEAKSIMESFLKSWSQTTKGDTEEGPPGGAGTPGKA